MSRKTRRPPISGALRGLYLIPLLALVAIPSSWPKPGPRPASRSLASVTSQPPGAFSRNLAPETLVLFNSNLTEARDLARYYALKRSIPSQNICGVPWPLGTFSSLRHLQGARNRIVRSCICSLIPVSNRPNPCDETQLAAIASRSRITHLAILKGVPTRLTETSWAGDNEEPSLDYYLARSIYDPQFLVPEYTGSTPTDPLYTERSRFGFPPPLNPAEDRILAYGRIEAITFERTRALIDRTLESERLGLRGNTLIGVRGSSSQEPVLSLFRDLLGVNPGCQGANSDTCRLQASWNGSIPGEPGSEIPIARQAGFFNNSQYEGNGQSAFDGFSTLLQWRIGGVSCLPLCSQIRDPWEAMTCRERSQDYFKELNTDCVGTAPGFMGSQLRSFTVQYYGFYPDGFTAPWGGEMEKTAPDRISAVAPDQAFINSRYTDSQYLRFGQPQAGRGLASCLAPSGAQELCRPKLPIAIGHYFSAQELTEYSPSQETHIRFRYRNRGSGPSARLEVKFHRYDGRNLADSIPNLTLPLHKDHTQWTEAHWVVPASGLGDVAMIYLGLHASFAHELHGLFEVDGLEMYQQGVEKSADEVHFLDEQRGSFASSQHWVTDGDWAANAIDRLGAIAWWGSGSHFLTGGYGFLDPDAFHEAFSGGRSLGEANLRRGWNVVSGTLYGDPLYSPVAVRLRFRDHNTVLHRGNSSYFSIEMLTSKGDLVLNAVNGLGQAASTRWVLSACKSQWPERCDLEGLWNPIRSGQGAVRDLPLLNVKTLLPDPKRCGSLSLRLKVETDHPESFPLHHTVSLRYGPAPSEPPGGPQVDSQGNLLGDLNRDGTIDSADIPILLGSWGQGSGRADLDGDGQVGASDLPILLSQWGATLSEGGTTDCRFE